jgi:hypothetical protein
MDGDCMALVYEYMQEGTLQDKLKGHHYLTQSLPFLMMEVIEVLPNQTIKLTVFYFC